MSVGPAALGNVLVQRLDAVLGTTMSAASANQVSGARPDAVSQPGNLDKPGSADGSNRDPRQGIQTGGARGDRPPTVLDAKTAAALAGMQIVKELYIPGKLVNVVVKPQ